VPSGDEREVQFRRMADMQAAIDDLDKRQVL
jgi:hypothetical protein